MTDLEKLEQELSEKEKIFDEKYISCKDDYLSEEAEKMRHDIWSLRSKITDLKENGNDTNVGSIEDIARIAKLITTKFNNDYSIDNRDKEAIEHILSDYKRVLKENEYMHNELDKQQTTINKYAKENEEYSKQLDLDYVDKNYISKKKIEDIIEELKGKLEDISRRREKSKTKEEKTVLWCLEIRTDERIKTLQELL